MYYIAWKFEEKNRECWGPVFLQELKDLNKHVSSNKELQAGTMGFLETIAVYSWQSTVPFVEDWRGMVLSHKGDEWALTSSD